MEINRKSTIEKLQSAIDEWLSPDNNDLRKAIEATVDDGLFSFEDIKYQVLALKKTLKKGEFDGTYLYIYEAKEIREE